ncbi:hypothetical protein FNH13_12955 [Ornithinimicrobium ciconiae]|uniref:ATP-grasp domain-containing protein n=1 Tax=Ornithinimicrobium ciconiae TaxID=2594265 RepID=A0A516GC74_9MICO|nr:ATP-grasp fold amidoligase family protein [Ornithinimicrobium ciconiae]QDO89123.1 hypothetical protein FNH13_12955 [Ornithinimicrobium ciconiae]
MGLRARLRQFPPIAWRDERLTQLRQSEKSLQRQLDESTQRVSTLAAQLEKVTQERDQVRRQQREGKYSPVHPSWHVRIMEQARVGRYTAPRDPERDMPRRRLLAKLHNYELARSYGIATPRVIGSWPRIEDVPWAELPDTFVVKSNRGYSGNGVLPLRRHGDGFRFIDSADEIDPEGIVRHYEKTKGLAGPYFVEEVLPGTGAVLPDDVKIYAFHGEVVFAMLRRVTKHADLGSFSYRFLDPAGQDLGQLQEVHRHDPDIAVPRDLAQMVEAARVLSLAMPVPFVRVDLYQVPEGIMLGELTPLPGSSAGFTREYDRLLGGLYDEAEGRLNLEFARGRPYAVAFGPHDRDVTAPMAATSSLPHT